MFRLLIRLFDFSDKARVLGRWGYHWDDKLLYKKYYD